MDNQIEHLCCLLKWRMDRSTLDEPDSALQYAVGKLHHKVLTNYRQWVRKVNLQRPVPNAGEEGATATVLPLSTLSCDAWELTGLWGLSSGEDERRWVCNAQLHQLMLWYLIWGEAANLRHMPELLCFILYCLSNALVLPCTGSPWEVRQSCACGWNSCVLARRIT